MFVILNQQAQCLVLGGLQETCSYTEYKVI